ncbi:hypothetical protein N3K66_005568 [Trichothecium roseum]|uniref:Uncharacterized protein n=1 Tax=Trichothecium roseum TaxID=47278 RepID=A0ACC0UY81_9HYPO|nr:hypothetical protein N3K66_005568 [Trichothecium roseum]
MGNGNRAQQKRERNAKDNTKVAKSQLKTNAQACDIICQTCRSTFLKTTKAPALTEHATNKHNKTIEECFPTFQQ